MVAISLYTSEVPQCTNTYALVSFLGATKYRYINFSGDAFIDAEAFLKAGYVDGSNKYMLQRFHNASNVHLSIFPRKTLHVITVQNLPQNVQDDSVTGKGKITRRKPD